MLAKQDVVLLAAVLLLRTCWAQTEAHLQTFHLTGFQLNLMSFFLLQLSVTAWPFAGCSFLFLYWTSYYIAGTLPCHLYSGGSNTSEAMLV